MIDDERQANVDLSVEPETMLAIRDAVREDLVRKLHALRIIARVNRKVGKYELAQQQEADVRRMIRMIAALEDDSAEEDTAP